MMHGPIYVNSSSCSRMTGRRTVKFVRLVLKVVMQYEGDFVDVILL